MIFYQIHVFLRCFIRSSKTSLFTVIPSTWGKPYNLGSLGSPGRCWAPWAAWAPWALLGYPGQFLGDPSYRIHAYLPGSGALRKTSIITLYSINSDRIRAKVSNIIVYSLSRIEQLTDRVCKQHRRIPCVLPFICCRQNRFKTHAKRT